MVIVLAALAASLISMIVAVPVALGLWAARLWQGLGVGTLLAVAASAALVAGIGREPAFWVLANAAAGLPVIVVAILVRLGAVPAGSLRIATVSGFSPVAQMRFLVVPRLLPATLFGGLGVFACAAAELCLGR